MRDTISTRGHNMELRGGDLLVFEATREPETVAIQEGRFA
jgi:hypothetical protein